jgi:hypothetical protein
VRSKRRNPNRFSRLAIERLTHACEIERSFAAALKLRFLAVAMKTSRPSSNTPSVLIFIHSDISDMQDSNHRAADD